MDDMAAYYPPQSGLPHDPRYPYYHPPPPPPPPAVAEQHYHLPQLFHPQPPPFASYAPPPYSQSSHDQVRTLFVAGLPEDVKAREIYNLFREFPGYESSHLRSPNASSLPFAFAVFMDQQSAIAAMQALNGMVFDLEKGSTLYIDLAKSNSRSKRTRFDDEKPGSEKRSKGSAAFSRGIHDPDEVLISILRPHSLLLTISLISWMMKNLARRREVKDLLHFQGAFMILDAACSSEALNHLQGTILYSSPPGEGMRLEYPSEAH
ncbi:hypothetical protein TEA_001641 [Camellia sinensis var. sinensis]|uniref:RRM domain-containing protein n=1 Tax=Camellia sinensis var. sinensis TaxID=542762 RepID=A0A4S4EPR4_CAMSN|nr:hypothetical protein TEA_001641 [Camellia sinensis var. sinensis]